MMLTKAISESPYKDYNEKKKLHFKGLVIFSQVVQYLAIKLHFLKVYLSKPTNNHILMVAQ